jgi:hypothetical protein
MDNSNHCVFLSCGAKSYTLGELGMSEAVGPKKWYSPVGDPERLDLIGKRNDGGVDLLLVVARPLDLSPADVGAVSKKFRNYCRYVKSREFAAEFGAPSRESVRIGLRSDWEVPRPLIELISQIAAEEQTPARPAIFYETPS